MMPDKAIPGGHIEARPARPQIEALRADTAAFAARADLLGVAPGGPITSAANFAAAFATADALSDGAPNMLWAAVQGFFANGGRSAQILAIAPGVTPEGHRSAIAGLADTGAALIAAPDIHVHSAPDEAVAALVAAAGPAFALIDPPPGLAAADVREWRHGLASPDAALSWPWLLVPPGGIVPPSGHVAGVMARMAAAAGVWKSPANIPLAWAAGAEVEVTSAMQDALNPEGINVIRRIPAGGISLWGARTLSNDPERRFIATQRLTRNVAASLEAGLGWTVSERHGEALWSAVRSRVDVFLAGLWRAGALAGATSQHAFFVRCDRTTMTQDDIENGRLVLEVGIAPVRPAEFVIIRIGAWTADHPDA